MAERRNNNAWRTLVLWTPHDTGRYPIGSRSLLIALVFGLLFASPELVLAQDCGTSCQRCLLLGREGVNHRQGAPNDMRCRFGSDCKPCHEGQEGKEGPRKSLGDADASETEILRAFLDATPDQLPGVVAKYRERILLHHPRQLLAVRGSDCLADHVTAVTFLSKDRLEALRRFTITRLDDFLTAHSGEATVEQ